MDVSKSEQQLRKLAAVDTTRQPLVLSEKNNAALTTRHPRTREVSSRYKSPTPSSPSGSRRFPSPNATRTTPTPFQAVQKRAVSTERKRPSTPSSPQSFSTLIHDSSTAVPVSSRRLSTGRIPEGLWPSPSPQSFSTLIHDSSTAVPVSSRRLSTGRIPESLWPSTMRNLSVSFQSDNMSVTASKKEKSVSNVSLDRTLRPSSNVADRKQSETSTLSRKPSPERKRSLLQGKHAHDQSENAKPVDSSRKPSPDRKISLLQGKYAHDQSENTKHVDGSRKPSPERKKSLLQGKYEHDQSENAKPDDGSGKPSPEKKRSLLHGKYAPDQSENAEPVDGSQKPSPEKKRSLLRGKYAPDQSENAEPVDASRKPNPERKRSFLQGKYAPDQSENVKSVDDLPSRLIEQHRWPSRIGGKLSSSSLNRSVDLGDKIVKNLPTPIPGIASSVKKMPMSDSSGKPLLKSSSESSRLLSLDEIARVGSEAISIDYKTLRAALPARILSASALDKMITTSGSRAQSPSRPSVSRGVSQSRGRPSTPPIRGVSPTPRVDSPSRMRTSNSSSQSHSSTSVLSSAPRGVSPTPRVDSPSRMRTSTSSSQSHSSTSVLSSAPRGVSPTPRVDSPSRMRTSTSSSQSHSSTSVFSSSPRGVSPTPRVDSPSRMSTSTSSSQSHSSTSILSSAPRGVSPTPRVDSPSRMSTSTSSSQSHSSTSVPSSASRGVSPTPRVDSPSRMRTSTSSSQSHNSTSVFSSAPRGVSPTPRVVSPTRMRTSTSSNQSHSSTSVLSFITDFNKGGKNASYIEDAHQLRLLYNRYLQWRFANAHAEAVLFIEKVNVEETLYNVWNTNLSLWDALIKKKIKLQRLKLELKLNSVLNDQMEYLNDWALLEREHTSSLAGAVEDLEASTLRLPITGGARVDTESLKAAISSAVDVMQAMGSSICSLLPKVEGVNHLVSEYAAIAAEEKNMLDQCEALLSSTAAMQLEEYSLRSHLIQTKETLKRNKLPIMATKSFPWP